MAAAPQHASQAPTDADAPRKPYVLGAWLAYDPDETLEQFFARKKDALQAGDEAWREGKIKAHHQKLYEHLIDAVGAHQYAWVKVETLAAAFKSNQSTVKRWLAALEKAQLIRRQRQFKTSSRTYVTAYDQRQAQASSEDQAKQGESNKEAEQPNGADAASSMTSTGNHTPNDAAADVQAANAEAVFFEREDAPTQSAFLTPQIKDSLINTSDSLGINGGGKKYTFDITTIDSSIRAIIDDEAINSDHGRYIVATRPLDELRAVQGYLDGQTNVRDRPGLFVWLNERAFGAELLAGRVQTASKRQVSRAYKEETARRRRSSRKQPPSHTGRPDSDYRCVACGHISPYLCLDDPFCDACGVHPGDEFGKNDGLIPDPALWTTILTRLSVAHVHHQEWLTAAMIAQYEEFLILACPHKRVRDMTRTYYLNQIDAIASEVLGRPVTVELTVKYMPHTSEHQRKAWESDDEQDARMPHDLSTASTSQYSQRNNELWSKMVAYINPPAKMDVFFQRCYVAHQTPEQVLVIATPNCIVRDELCDTWLVHLQDAAVAVLGRAVNIAFVIDGEAPTMSCPATQPVCDRPVRVAHTETHSTLEAEQVHAAASRSGDDGGKDMHPHDGDPLSAEACERVWRTLPWRLPITASERAMWFSHTTRLHQCANGRAMVTAPTASDVKQLTRYQDLIEDELSLLLGRPITVEIIAVHAATAQEQQEDDHNERVSSGAINVVRDRGELDAVDHECPSACQRSAPASEEVAEAPHDPKAEYAAIWKQAIAQLHLDNEDRRAWLDPTTLVGLDDQHAVVAVPSVFIWRAVEHRYRTDLEGALGALLHRSVRVEVIIKHNVPNVL